MEIEVNKQLYSECKKYLPNYWLSLLFQFKRSDETGKNGYYLQVSVIGADSFKYNLGDEIERKYSTGKYNLIRLAYVLLLVVIVTMYATSFLYMLITFSVSLILLSELNLIHLKQYVNQKHMYANALIKELMTIGIIAHQTNVIDTQASAITEHVGIIDNVNRTAFNVQAKYDRLCELTAYEDMDVIKEHRREVDEMEGIERQVYTIFSESIN